MKPAEAIRQARDELEADICKALRRYSDATGYIVEGFKPSIGVSYSVASRGVEAGQYSIILLDFKHR